MCVHACVFTLIILSAFSFILTFLPLCPNRPADESKLLTLQSSLMIHICSYHSASNVCTMGVCCVSISTWQSVCAWQQKCQLRCIFCWLLKFLSKASVDSQLIPRCTSQLPYFHLLISAYSHKQECTHTQSISCEGDYYDYRDILIVSVRLCCHLLVGKRIALTQLCSRWELTWHYTHIQKSQMMASRIQGIKHQWKCKSHI